MINQKNSFITLAEQVALLNKNAVEIITSLSDVVTDKNSSVDVNLLNSDGTKTKYYLPTVNQLKSEIEIANSNIERLAGLVDNNVYITDGTTTRKVYVDDLNREPEPINELNKVTKFVSINNSFFEALSNPLLSVNIDLTDKIDRKVNKVLSRRYIINFLKDDEGNYTEDGEISKSDFEEKFLNNNDVYIDDFTEWYNNVDNVGILKSDEPYDEQTFDLDYDKLQYYGIFDVLAVDNDTINNKMWYVLGSLTYFDVDGNPKQLSINDELIINKKNSASKWKVLEISTAKSNYRVILERVMGLDAVPILNQGLKIYSPEVSNKSIKVSIGFDEYNIIFIKPINTDSNVVSTTWSYGTCFYTNDLVLDSQEKISMNKYYSEVVFDYGTLLKDMIIKNIPSKYGKKPNKPELIDSNFKVVQINKHLTDYRNIKKAKELYTQKTSVKSKLDELNNAITSKTRELNTVYYKSTSDKTAANARLDNLISEQETQTKLYSSLVSQISSIGLESTTESPKYRIRGFWSFPEPIVTAVEGYQKNQEVVQFEIQYRYSSKNGAESSTEGFSLNINKTTYSSKVTNTATASQQRGNYMNPDITTQNVNTTGYFSNWNSIKSDVRRRKYNKTLDVWYWEIEDVSDADTPNINQLDIPVKPDERVEIRIRSISEVGYPNALLMSDWSETLTIDFPDDLKDVGNESDLILNESQNEELYVQLESKFRAQGLTTHLQQSFYNKDQYISHMDSNIGTTFKDDNGNMITLYYYLKELTDRISALEDKISKAKGELVVKLYSGTNETIIENGASIFVSVIAEDYAEPITASTRSYHNRIYAIKDYYIKFENISKSSELGLLSWRKFKPVSGTNNFYNPSKNNNALACYVDTNGYLNAQVDNQFIYIQDTSGGLPIYHSGMTFNDLSIDDDTYILESNYNIGLSGFTEVDSDGNYASPLNLFPGKGNGIVQWSGHTEQNLLCTIHPYIEDINLFVYSDSSGEKIMKPNSIYIMPINIFFQLSGVYIEDKSNIDIDASATNVITRIKKVRFFVEPENLSRSFEFEITFRIHRLRSYNVKTNVNVGNYGNTNL